MRNTVFPVNTSKHVGENAEHCISSIQYFKACRRKCGKLFVVFKVRKGALLKQNWTEIDDKWTWSNVNKNEIRTFSNVYKNKVTYKISAQYVKARRRKMWKTALLFVLVFYVTCNDISVIFVTAKMFRRTEEEVVPTVGLQTPFCRVL